MIWENITIKDWDGKQYANTSRQLEFRMDNEGIIHMNHSYHGAIGCITKYELEKLVKSFKEALGQ